jgi:hypothetical protein
MIYFSLRDQKIKKNPRVAKIDIFVSKENFCKKNQISKFPVFPFSRFHVFFRFPVFHAFPFFKKSSDDTDTSKVRSFVTRLLLFIIIRNFLELKKVGCGCISLAVLIFSALIILFFGCMDE